MKKIFFIFISPLLLMAVFLSSCTKEPADGLFFSEGSFTYSLEEAKEGVMLEVNGSEKAIKQVRWKVPTKADDAVVIGFPAKGKMIISFKHAGEFEISAVSGDKAANCRVIIF